MGILSRDFVINWIISKIGMLLSRYRKLNRPLPISLLIIALCCPIFADANISNFQKYFRTISNSEKQRISNKKVCLQKTNYAYPKPIYYRGTQIPNVFIDESVIKDPEMRYKVSCYLINKLDLGIHFEFADYEFFVIKNKKIIGECVYYLCHKEYGRIYKQLNDGCDRLLRDTLIQDELDLIKERLKSEHSLFLYCEPIGS
ncbi:hypothetical protein HRI97_03445 [Treponema socranskii subsp. buccale]|jgi:hypothetical protein|uniref:hypothetical protein n=1 Tax=Treponema socranskii TaxID=53419 RepID=UPI0020A39A88|nr:hypothetical protein [Treponema socranskii]UTD02184.1 hypothetical protein HRI97_03445 [Treponema socranskii subsp. buccale]